MYFSKPLPLIHRQRKSKWACKWEYKWASGNGTPSNIGRHLHGCGPHQISPSKPMHTTEGRSHLGSLVGSHANKLGTELQLLPWNNFRHLINCILTCVNLLQLEAFHFCSITNPVISDFNMLFPLVISGILAQVYCTLTITLYHLLFLFQTRFLEKILHPQYIFVSFSGRYIFSFSCG